MHDVIDGLVDAESFFEVKPLFAPELVVGLGLLDGRPVGIVANNPAQRRRAVRRLRRQGARFIWLCDAFNIPLVFLADVPGFMIGTEVERQGIIRHGAKMITAVSEATVPKVSVIVRKAYGAGLYAMSGPAFEPEATLALPTAKIAVMGPEAAVNAVFANKIAAIEDPDEREAFVPSSGGSTRRTSTCCAWPPSWWSTPSSSSPSCGTRSSAGWRSPRARTAASPPAATACPRCSSRCPGATTARGSDPELAACRRPVSVVRAGRGRTKGDNGHNGHRRG